MFVLALLLIPDAGRTEVPSQHALPAYDLAKLPMAEAQKLQGHLVNFTIHIDSPPGDYDGWTVYDCESPDPTVRTVWLHEERIFDPEKPHVVQGRLKVIAHPPRVILGQRFSGFWECRVVEAAAQE